MMGTLNELTIAYDEKKIIGLLSGTGGASALFLGILVNMEKSTDNVFSSENPLVLVEKIIDVLDIL